MLPRRRLRDLRDIEVDGVATTDVQNLTTRENNSEALDPAPRCSIHKAARSAGITGDRPAQERHRFGGIRWIKLSSKLGSSMQFMQRDSRTNRGLVLGNLQPS